MEFDYEITEKPQFHVLGMVLEGIPFMQGPQHIPQLWHRFVPRYGEIEDSSVEPHGEFGAMKDFDHATKTFKYLAGIPVSAEAQVPNGMERWIVPAQTFIAVKCQLATLMPAVECWNRWVSRSADFEYAGGIEFEWYPPGYHEAPDKNWMYYCFPIRKKK
jgi:predicted transcriptional regulator YdeE